MMRGLLLSILVFAASPRAADDVDIKAFVEGHILPGYQAFATEPPTWPKVP